MFWRWILLALLCGILGQTWWWAWPQDRLVTGPDYFVLQTKEGPIYSFGTQETLQTVRPLGYFSATNDWLHPQDLPVGERRGHLTRWSANFTVIDTGRTRLFLFTGDIAVGEIQNLPVDFRSDVWVLDRALPPAFIPSPKEKIIWLAGDKRPPKKLKALEQTIIETGKVGQVWITGSEL